MLLKINERKRWSDPPPSDPERKAAQDEEIFQTARLVNCGHFMAMIFGDYVAVSIVNMYQLFYHDVFPFLPS